MTESAPFSVATPAPKVTKTTKKSSEVVKPPTKSELKKRAIYEQIVRLRHLQKLTVVEIARRLQVSERTIYTRIAEPDYQEALTRLREEWKDATVTEVYELGSEVLQTLRDLMGPGTKSEHVRFEAAAKLGDWMGLGTQLQDEQQHDDTSELERLFVILEERQRAIQTQTLPPPQPGGLLPDLPTGFRTLTPAKDPAGDSTEDSIEGFFVEEDAPVS